MGNPRYQTRLPQDVAQDVDSYVEERGINQSEGVRRLIQEGIDKHQNRSAGTAPTSKLIERLGWAFLALGLAGLALELPTAAGGAAIVAAALFIGGAAVRWRGETA